MKKLTLILATAAVLSLGSLLSPQQARADAGATIAIVGGVGWLWCNATYGRERVGPGCAVSDYWRARWEARRR